MQLEIIINRTSDPDATHCQYSNYCRNFAHYTVRDQLLTARVCTDHLEPQIAYMSDERARMARERSDFMAKISYIISTCSASDDPAEIFVDTVVAAMASGQWEEIEKFCCRVVEIINRE